MVGGYTEDLTKPQSCHNWGSCMHSNRYLLVYIYSSIRGKKNEHNGQFELQDHVIQLGVRVCGIAIKNS